MTWFWVALVVAYLIGIRVVGRRYFVRRHGVPWHNGEQGTLTAGLVGGIWPVALLVPAVRHPTLCSHGRHVLEHQRLVDDAQRTQAIIQRRG